MTQAFPWPIQNISEWQPLWQAAGFFCATFILEDVAAIAAGLLLATGAVTWPTAFFACFLGIWFGDAGLYSLARFGGRHWFEQSRFQRFGKRVAESERWFARRGTPILIFSRLLPGARLPTYFAAGFLRVPWRHFLMVTGIASLVWTVAILLLVRLAGENLLHWFGKFKYGGWTLSAVVVLFAAAIQLTSRTRRTFHWNRLAPKLVRWRHWEFWPAWMFYPPVAVYYLWLAVKYRSLTLPTAANPGIFSGGMVGESKMATLRDLSATSPEFTADAELLAGFTPEDRLRSLLKVRERLRISYPFILKPDVGQRGVGIKLIRSIEQAEAYLQQTSAPVIVQRYVPGPHEVGIFYYRFPHEMRGHIFAITEKIFPSLIGDGESTIAELIWRDPRARFMADRYLARLADRQDEILAKGKMLKLVEAGNHAQGCIFRDGKHLGTPALLDRIDGISRKLPGFYIGRYDIRYSSEEDLKNGDNFQIIELNGAASEATSIYDARNSLVTAYRTLFRQWKLVFAIGATNRKRGCEPTELSLLWKAWRRYSETMATYPSAD